ncbi:tyrosine-type recombinase/integrase [Halpernia sp. GG3]
MLKNKFPCLCTKCLIWKKFSRNNYDCLKECIVELLYQTGIRKAELCNLIRDNVDFEKFEILVQGKGNKTRIIPVSENLCRKITILF